MKTEDLMVADLVPYDRNAKKHDDKQITNVMESIRQFGFAQPIVVDKNNVVIIGHCRLIAAKRLGLRKVPVLRMEELTEEQAQKLRLLDNKLNESDWDMELLAEDIPELDWSEFDIDWGLPMMEDADVDIVEVETPEPPKEPESKLGDIYQLGDHRLICGDSTDPKVIEKLMDGDSADLYLTDPPYNVNISNSAGMTIKNDNMEDSKFRTFLTNAFAAVNDFIKPGGAFYIWHADTEGLNFRVACREVGWQIRQCLIWNKNMFILGRQDYQWKHEPCLYGWKDGAAHYFINDRTNTTVIGDEVPDFSKMKKEEMQELLEKIYKEKTTVINADKPTVNDLHPTMKPIALIAELVKNSSQKGDIVLDSFGGSGSTLIACEELGRRCRTCELDPKYVDVIVQRWEDFTGGKAVKLNG